MFDVNQFTRLYRRTIRASGITGSLVRLSLKPVSAKKLRVLSHVSIENQTSNFTKVRLGIHNRGEDHYIDELQAVSADELCVSVNDIMLGDGDKFFAEFTGTTDDDSLIMYCSGWEQNL